MCDHTTSLLDTLHVFELILVLVDSAYALAKYMMNKTTVVKLAKFLQLVLVVIALCNNAFDILIEAEIDLRNI